jgi:hypothetical protein
MPRERRDERLYDALRTFGRNERQLSAANLEHNEKILSALRGEGALRHDSERHKVAQVVEKAMRQVIEEMTDRAKRRAAEVVFASQPEFYGLYVNERIAVVTSNKEDLAFLGNQYKRMREWVLDHMAVALPHALATAESQAASELMSPTAMRAARQLYRYAQATLVVLEAFNDCVRFETELRSRFGYAQAASVDLVHIDHGWLGKFGEPGHDFRIVPVGRGLQSDEALWAFAYYNKYRRVLLKEPSARDYLRENLHKEQWLDVQRGAPFTDDEVAVLESYLDATEIDESHAYMTALCRAQDGRAVVEKWVSILATNRHERDGPEMSTELLPTTRDRSRLIPVLLGLCMALQDFFPRETLILLDFEYRHDVSATVSEGLRTLHLPPSVEDFERRNRLAEDIASRRPPRYTLRDRDEPTWTDELPKHNPWAY